MRNKILDTLIAATVLTGLSSAIYSEKALSNESTSDTLILTGTIRDFKESHPDFESTIGTDKNIVTTELGSDGKPVYAHGSSGTLTTNGKENFDQWYNDVPGINQSKQYSIELTKQADGNYKYQNNQFFPINNELFGNYKDGKNYHFTYELHNQFTYKGGEVFTFSGDDDVWVYIDGKRVIDIGGVHTTQSQTVDLDTLGLTPGETYSFDFFFAERHYSQSNFTITTNIELNNPPIANKDIATVNILNTITIDALANDTDEDGDELSLAGINATFSGGQAVIEDNKIVYTAGAVPGGFSLTYTVQDARGETSKGTVEINVVASAD